MKKIITSSIFLLFGVIGFSQPGPAPQAATPEQIAQRQANALSERLSLTEDQRSKAYAVYLDAAKKELVAREARMKEMQRIRQQDSIQRKQQDDKINQLLTADQKQRYQEQRPQAGGRRGGPGAPGLQQGPPQGGLRQGPPQSGFRQGGPGNGNPGPGIQQRQGRQPQGRGPAIQQRLRERFAPGQGAPNLRPQQGGRLQQGPQGRPDRPQQPQPGRPLRPQRGPGN